MNFLCKHPKSYTDSREHLAKLCADLIDKYVATNAKVVDAGCGNRELERYCKNYIGVDLLEGHNIEESIPKGDVVCFIDVLEHVEDLAAVLNNVDADYVLISMPMEHRLPDSDHKRRISMGTIERFTEWELMNYWMWILQPKFWRLKTAFPFASPFAEELISLWKVNCDD